MIFKLKIGFHLMVNFLMLLSISCWLLNQRCRNPSQVSSMMREFSNLAVSQSHKVISLAGHNSCLLTTAIPGMPAVETTCDLYWLLLTIRSGESEILFSPKLGRQPLCLIILIESKIT